MSVRLAYFLKPVTAYEPRYATSWVMRLAAACGATPAALANAPDAALGTRTAASVYGASVNLNALSPALAGCGMWNNSVVTLQRGRLHVVAECLEFDRRKTNPERTRMIVVATEPTGAPSQWRWTYVGVLADRALAQALGAERLVSATIARGRDGALLFIATPQTGAYRNWAARPASCGWSSWPPRPSPSPLSRTMWAASSNSGSGKRDSAQRPS